MRSFLRRRRVPALVAALATVATLIAVLTAGAATPIPVPDPLVEVTTRSGNVTKTHLVPIGGAPIPIDVDGPAVTGLLEPDVDVSVGLVAIEELPGKPVVPNVVVKRNVLALNTNRPAPPLDLEAKIVLRDAADGLKPLVTVKYGFATPGGARVPPVLSAKLVGPVQGGFVDPLQAKIESPGYSGPLDIRIAALTDGLDAKFELGFDALPESIFITEDPRDDGLDVTYEHNAPVADVHLKAAATLKNRATNEVLEVGAEIERLPQRIALHNTNTPDGTTRVAYESSSALAKPDLEATYRDLDKDGRVVTDANVKVAGLPAAMEGAVTAVGGAVDKVDFRVLGGEEIGAVDFVARNYVGPSGPVPAPNLNPEQHVAVGTRFVDGATRWRAAGRLLGIRSATVERLGDKNDILDARTDLGDGVRPLRALLDVDNRPDPSVKDEDDQRLKIDTTIAPLPERIHTVFEPSTGADDPLRLLYESSRTIDVDATALIAKGPADGCGQPDVLCATARVDKVPRTLEALLPGTGGTDFNLSHDGGAAQRPDVRATIDTTDAAAKRAYADVRIDRVPNEVTGRLDTKNGILRAAEFHACKFDFSDRACTTPQQALGRVAFIARDQPERGDLPPRADTDRTFVSLIKRDARFEAAGEVREVRNVEFRQREAAPKTLGAKVDVGSKEPFDVVVDSVEGAKDTKVRIDVGALPDLFSACVRGGSEDPQPDGLDDDALLGPCEDDELETGDGEPDLTPLTAIYTASAETDVRATARITEPDPEDANRPAVTRVRTAILPLPERLRVDAISPITPDRRLQLRYAASRTVPKVEFGFERRRDTDICEDPRPGRKALCAEGVLSNLPESLLATYDPDEAKGDLEFTSSAPADGAGKLSVDPFVLTKVTQGAQDQPLLVDAKLRGLTRHVVGKVVQRTMATDAPGEKSLATLRLDACPPDLGDDCTGIDEIGFTATNALVGDPLPAAPAKDPDTTQDFTFVGRGADFRAQGSITKFKEIGLDRLKSDGEPGATTKVRAAFGDGTAAEKLRAFVDRENVADPETGVGSERQKVHAVISEAPEAIELCYRDALTSPDQPAAPASDVASFCDKAPAGKLAVQTRLDEAAGAVKPDIELREILLAKAGGTDVLTGTVSIRDLAQRIDVLAGKGADTDVLVEGHDLDDGPGAEPKDVAGRVTFDLRNFSTPEPTQGFPYAALSGTPDVPQANFAKVIKDDDLLLLQGSIPNIKRVALRPGPCQAGDPRFPTAGFPAELAPSYQCVNLIAAQNQKLGLTIRTKDNKGEIVSLDEGVVDTVPGGAGGLFATLGKSPDAAKLNAACGSGQPRSTPAEGCRPPLLSLRAPKSGGQTSNLQARLAIGPLNAVEQLRNAVPLDSVSKRLLYEQPVKDYAKRGARVKLASGGGGFAARAGLNLDLPNFLDLDQPSSYSCKRDDVTSGAELDPDDPACRQDDVSAEDGNGFASQDIGLRLVGANDAPLGTDVASLGRAAILVIDDKGKQTVLTGAFPAEGANGTIPDDPTSSPPETEPPTGDHDLGLALPGHLDARVAIRGKYEAANEETQTSYIQVDGRTNEPLNLALRDVQSEALDQTTLQTGRTRSGKDVAAVQLSLRGAPGLGGNAPDLSKPTFRLRTEMRKKFDEDAEVVGPYECKGFNAGGGRTAGFGANFCLYVPGDHIEKWLDVGLNMSPGATPTRTMDVVMDTRDYTQIDMRAFDAVDGSGGALGKGAPARFTPQAGLRLQPFPIGLEVGLGLGIVGGNTKLLLDGDVILKLTGRENSRLRLSQNKGALRLLAEDGPDPAATVKTHNSSRAIVQVRAEALFGLISKNVVDVNEGPYHQRIRFKKCAFPNVGIFTGSDDRFDVAPSDSTKTAITFVSSDVPGGAAAAKVLTAASNLLAPIWCIIETKDDELVTGNHPAPAFDEPGRPIGGGGAAAPPSAGQPQLPPAQPTDLVVGPGETAGADVTLCNTTGFKNVRVKNGGTIRVGREGQVVTETLDPDGPGPFEPENVVTTCTGTLALKADSVTVDAGGLITASAALTTQGTGAPGSGGAAGGGGGGTLLIDATNFVDNKGAIVAGGGAGTAAGGGCAATGAGGGKGGDLTLTANLVVNGAAGTIAARGGQGGAGGNGGRGGDGGRVTINTVAPKPASGLSATAGGGGTAGAGCTAGSAGSPGDATPGTTLTFAAGVSFDTPADVPPTYVRDSVALKVRAVKNGGGPLKVLVCQRSVGVAGNLGSPGLDPAGGSLQELIDSSNCQTESFAGPNVGSNVYERSITRNVADGFHGFFAIAATPGPNAGADCTDVGAFPFGHGCEYQSEVVSGDRVLPELAQVKVAADSTGPTLTATNPSGTETGCVDGRRCLSQPGTLTTQAADTQGGVGLSGVFCSRNGGPFDIPCGPGAGVTIDFGVADGPQDIRVRAIDQLGNTTTIDGPRWFVDRSGGGVPELTLTNSGVPVNGWFTAKPKVTVHAEDDGAGYDAQPITLFTDTSKHSCGTVSGRTVDFGFISISLPQIADCGADETKPFVPEDGIHTFQAQATDKLGNLSLKSEVKRMKVDTTPPTTAIFLGPKDPDGAAGWYTTKPFVAFRAVDTVGGSGVDLGKAPSKIELDVDGQGFQTWDPAAPNLLSDGIHEVCYRATDVAGNTSPVKCKANIKVDSTAPTVSDPIAPAAPDGDNGFYLGSPSVDGQGADGGSGLSRVELQLDGGPWQTAAPTQIAEGVHTVRTRAFDVAGNPSPILERTIRVDRSDPSALMVSFPPQPNQRGWFRRHPVDAIAVSDGRDGSGPDGATYRVDGAPASSYLEPFKVTDGVRDVRVRARDRAGRVGTEGQRTQAIDTQIPTGEPTGRAKDVIVQFLGLPARTTLAFTAADQLNGKVKVRVHVYNPLGNLVRRLDVPGPHADGYRDPGAGSVTWDARDPQNRGVLPGLYHYRVQVTDRAGNTLLSKESPTFLVLLGLIPG
ncbi:MAG: hypothetical protein WKF96_08445 [Solirubrobacteraceae bacterium]